MLDVKKRKVLLDPPPGAAAVATSMRSAAALPLGSPSPSADPGPGLRPGETSASYGEPSLYRPSKRWCTSCGAAHGAVSAQSQPTAVGSYGRTGAAVSSLTATREFKEFCLRFYPAGAPRPSPLGADGTWRRHGN